MRLLAIAAVIVCASPTIADERPSFDRKEDLVYGRKFGVALTMDVFVPTEKNGAGIIYVVSGGWVSSKESINAAVRGRIYDEFLKRGYVVFAVLHGCQPKFTIPEIIDDMHRAVRYIRFHAKDYGIDRGRLGICGASAGGHLSLMQGCAPKLGTPKSGDPVEQESSRVQAVACFFPPTDFLNYGKPGEEAVGTGILQYFKAPFDFTERDPKTNTFEKITDTERRREIGKKISPVYHVTEQSAPVLIIHGDADTLVPIQQAQTMIEKLKEAHVPCELVVKEKALHGWPDMDKDFKILADWFDKHLGKKE